MDDQQSPTKSVTNLWDIFAIAPPNCSSARDVQSAKDLVNNDPTINREIADHIINFLDQDYLPDPSALSRAIISSHTIHGSFEVFTRNLFGGINFMRTGGGGRPSINGTQRAPSTTSPPSLQLEGGGSTPSGRNSRPASVAHVGDSRRSNTNDDPSASRTISPPSLQSEWGESAPSGRNSRFASSLWRRNGRKCEINENFDDKSLVGAHIFPSAIGSGNKKQQFLWELLACFWSPEVVGKIRTECSQINKFSNGISMSSEAQVYFDRLDFYLMPDLNTLSDKSYSATFNWVRRPNGGAIPNYRLECERKIDGHVYRRTMCDGDVIVFETVDPEKYPLPDPGLLWARALLSRVSRPVGGTGGMTLLGDHGTHDDRSRWAYTLQNADLVEDTEKVSRWLLASEGVSIFQEESAEYV